MRLQFLLKQNSRRVEPDVASERQTECQHCGVPHEHPAVKTASCSLPALQMCLSLFRKPDAGQYPHCEVLDFGRGVKFTWHELQTFVQSPAISTKKYFRYMGKLGEQPYRVESALKKVDQHVLLRLRFVRLTWVKLPEDRKGRKTGRETGLGWIPCCQHRDANSGLLRQAALNLAAVWGRKVDMALKNWWDVLDYSARSFRYRCKLCPSEFKLAIETRKPQSINPYLMPGSVLTVEVDMDLGQLGSTMDAHWQALAWSSRRAADPSSLGQTSFNSSMRSPIFERFDGHSSSLVQDEVLGYRKRQWEKL